MPWLSLFDVLVKNCSGVADKLAPIDHRDRYYELLLGPFKQILLVGSHG